MRRSGTRIRMADNGDVEVVDPGLDSLELLRSIDPDYRIQSAPLEGFRFPRFQATRSAPTPVSKEQIESIETSALWLIHEQASRTPLPEKLQPPVKDVASLLDVKCELASRFLRCCEMCGHRCGVNRWQGKAGVCGLGTQAYVAEHFIHIGEEPPINPSLVLNLVGYGLRCRYCQQGPLLNVASAVSRSDMLEPGLWNRLDSRGARSMSFIGGNPDESLFAILKFLSATPDEWNLPIVWNSHAYATQETMNVLNGIVDVYVPDFKYGDDRCAERLSGIRYYVATAQTTILAMIRQRVPVFVRMLVLPGHVECCHMPCLRFLAVHGEMILLSVRPQYCPDWKVGPDDGPLSRRPLRAEVEQVVDFARELGLRSVDGNGN